MSSTQLSILLFLSLAIISCSSSEQKESSSVITPIANENNHTKKISQSTDINISNLKIKLLFVSQPTCPSCKRLELTMAEEAPAQLLNKYFKIETIYYGETLPEGLPSPNGTPTVYFLGDKNELLLEPMIGEKTPESLIEFLEDAILEYKNSYHIDLEEIHDEQNSSA